MELLMISASFVCLVLVQLSDARNISWVAPINANGETSPVLETNDLNVVLATVKATTTAGVNITGYSVLASDMFEVRPAISGAIYLKAGKQLDYETATSYTISVRAIDSAGESSTATLAIKVADRNDNAPVYRRSDGEPLPAVDIENCLPAKAGELLNFEPELATDKDRTAPNNKVTYVIASGNPTPAKFAIGSSDARLTTTVLIENAEKFNLIVHAVDSGTPRLTGSIIYSITMKKCEKQGFGDEGSGAAHMHGPSVFMAVALLVLCVSLI